MEVPANDIDNDIDNDIAARRAELAACAAVLLDPVSPPGELLATCQRLADRFSQWTGFEWDPLVAPDLSRERKLPSGKAISAHDAARCLVDLARTTAFLRGIRNALDRLIDAGKQPVHVVYAGCGPFAALLTPLLPLYRPESVRLHVIEIQQASLETCQRLLRALDLESFVEAWHPVDAATYRHPSGVPLNLLVTETMQVALDKECQVAIAANLAPQLSADGIMIPERILLEAVLLDPRREFSTEPEPERPRVSLGTAFELNRDTATTISDDPRGCIPGGGVTIPENMTADQGVWILTHIEVHDGIRLGPHASGLTMPRMAPLETAVRPGDRLEFGYQLGATPGLRCRVKPGRESKSQLQDGSIGPPRNGLRQ